jgi:IS1 family transposase/transposase-like protein
MIVATCEHKNKGKWGKTKAGTPRLRCKDCGKMFTESTEKLGGMRIGMDQAARICELLCEGMSVAATARITQCDPHTILELLVYVGNQCKRFMEEKIKNVFVADIQADEIWQFIYCKRFTANDRGYLVDRGDSYCYTAIERNSKLLVAWHLGQRTKDNTEAFCAKLRRAVRGRFHLSTDGLEQYPPAVAYNFEGMVDYGQIIKIFRDPSKEERRKYSPPRIIGIERKAIMGYPEKKQTCTSHCERMNGSIRTFVKRMGRLTYCFSKKWENHEAALGLFFAHYNWCRKHKTLKGETPAMAHGLDADHPWTMRELLEAVTAV